MYVTIRKNQDGKFWWRAVGDSNEVIRGEASDAPTHDKISKVTKR